MLCVLIRSDSNKYTQYIIFNIKKKIILNYPKSAAMGFCSKGLKNKFETAVVNEPSVFEPLKFYCIMKVRSRPANDVGVAKGHHHHQIFD